MCDFQGTKHMHRVIRESLAEHPHYMDVMFNMFIHAENPPKAAISIHISYLSPQIFNKYRTI